MHFRPYNYYNIIFVFFIYHYHFFNLNLSVSVKFLYNLNKLHQFTSAKNK